MKKQCMDLSDQAENQVSDAVLRAKVLTAAIALAIVDTLPLPSGAVTDSTEYFLNQLQPGLMNTVSIMNECIVFDTRACLEQVRNLWKVRYHCAYRSCPTVLSTESFLGSFTGTATYLSADYIEFSHTNGAAIVSLAQFVNDCLAASALLEG
jgi:hypothetical protein